MWHVTLVRYFGLLKFDIDRPGIMSRSGELASNPGVADSPKETPHNLECERERERDRFKNREKRISKWLKKTQFMILLLKSSQTHDFHTTQTSFWISPETEHMHLQHRATIGHPVYCFDFSYRIATWPTVQKSDDLRLKLSVFEQRLLQRSGSVLGWYDWQTENRICSVVYEKKNFLSPPTTHIFISTNIW